AACGYHARDGRQSLHRGKRTQMKTRFIISGKDATSVELRDVPVPEPKAGELLVKVHAAGLNRGEFIAGHGLSGGAAKVGGIEAAGGGGKGGGGGGGLAGGP